MLLITGPFTHVYSALRITPLVWHQLPCINLPADMDPSVDWEDTKENYVPVKQGRSAAALSTPLSVSKRSNEVEKAKK